MIAKPAIIRTGLEILHFSGTYRFMRALVGGVGSILMFHHVHPPREGHFQPNKHLEVTPESLERVIDELHRLDVDLVSLDEMHRRLTERDHARRFACLTFDDGYRDNKQWALPILKAARARFAIYITTNFANRLGMLWWRVLETVIASNAELVLTIGSTERRIGCAGLIDKQKLFVSLRRWMHAQASEEVALEFVSELADRYDVSLPALCNDLCLEWKEIEEIAQDPLATVGVHTVSHTMLARSSASQVRCELEVSRAIIQKRLGVAAEHLAYPFGDRAAAGPREFRTAAELGFKTAVTARPGVLFEEHADHLMALPRIAVIDAYQIPRFIPVLMSGAPTALWNGFRRVVAT